MFSSVRTALIDGMAAESSITDELGQIGGLPAINKISVGQLPEYRDHEIPAVGVACGRKGEDDRNTMRTYEAEFMAQILITNYGNDELAAEDAAINVAWLITTFLRSEALGGLLGNVANDIWVGDISPIREVGQGIFIARQLIDVTVLMIEVK